MPAFKKPKKRSTGGVEIISSEIIQSICFYLKAGAYLETAAAYAGIHRDTLHDWLKKGRHAPKGKYGDLIRAVDKAMAEAELRDLLNIDKCAMGQDWEYERDSNGQLVLNGRGNPIPKKVGLEPDWHASAWRLERKHRDRWGKVERLETLSVPDKEETDEQKKIREDRVKLLTQQIKTLDEPS